MSNLTQSRPRDNRTSGRYKVVGVMVDGVCYAYEAPEYREAAHGELVEQWDGVSVVGLHGYFEACGKCNRKWAEANEQGRVWTDYRWWLVEVEVAS